MSRRVQQNPDGWGWILAGVVLGGVAIAAARSAQAKQKQPEKLPPTETPPGQTPPPPAASDEAILRSMWPVLNPGGAEKETILLYVEDQPEYMDIAKALVAADNGQTNIIIVPTSSQIPADAVQKPPVAIVVIAQDVLNSLIPISAAYGGDPNKFPDIIVVPLGADMTEGERGAVYASVHVALLQLRANGGKVAGVIPSQVVVDSADKPDSEIAVIWGTELYQDLRITQPPIGRTL